MISYKITNKEKILECKKAIHMHNGHLPTYKEGAHVFKIKDMKSMHDFCVKQIIQIESWILQLSKLISKLEQLPPHSRYKDPKEKR